MSKKLKTFAYGTYKFTDGSDRHVPRNLLNTLAPGMYALLKEIEWMPGDTPSSYVECLYCRKRYQGREPWKFHVYDCKLDLLLSTIESWDQEKFTLSWNDFEEITDVLKKVENDEVD